MGPAALLFDPSPDEVAGLLFNRPRMMWREIGRRAIAAQIGMAGEYPREVFQALADSPEEAEREYARYLAHKAANHAPGIP